MGKTRHKVLERGSPLRAAPEAYSGDEDVQERRRHCHRHLEEIGSIDVEDPRRRVCKGWTIFRCSYIEQSSPRRPGRAGAGIDSCQQVTDALDPCAGSSGTYWCCCRRPSANNRVRSHRATQPDSSTHRARVPSRLAHGTTESLRHARRRQPLFERRRTMRIRLLLAPRKSSPPFAGRHATTVLSTCKLPDFGAL